MSSREQILKAIKQNKPPEVPLPESFFITEDDEVNRIEKYIQTLSSIGGNCSVVNDLAEVQEYFHQKKEEDKELVNGIKALGDYNIEDYAQKGPTEVEGVDTVFLQGEIAVAENGSVWLPEKNMVNRILPFICQHLVFVIWEKNIVANMHEAYSKIQVDEDGYGLFIAGPSKTADIEQSLVIGAHGPLSLQVFIVRTV